MEADVVISIVTAAAAVNSFVVLVFVSGGDVVDVFVSVPGCVLLCLFVEPFLLLQLPLLGMLLKLHH